jgi:hypothetical protein
VKTDRCAAVVLLVVLFAAPASYASQDRANIDPVDPLRPDQAVAWKATLGSYRDSVTKSNATDINLRGNTQDTKFWLGYYQDQDNFTQSRAGVEQSTSLASYGQLISSLQVASGGFVGGSITWDGKQDNVDGFSPLLGWGRTNTKTYYNLNFDPNDSVLLGGTYSQSQLGQFSLYQIFDDRLKTGQRVTHLVWRGTLPNAMGLTLDAFERSGASDAGEPKVKGNGLSVTLDVRNYFVRMAYDQKANFTDANITRLAVGFRF